MTSNVLNCTEACKYSRIIGYRGDPLGRPLIVVECNLTGNLLTSRNKCVKGFTDYKDIRYDNGKLREIIKL